jgi:short-subunit dehydrogenase
VPTSRPSPYWKNKIVFLTGASSGIGEGLALDMAQRGATVGLFARRSGLLNDLAQRCETVGGKARAFAGDVRDATEVKRAAAALHREFGRIDILIANAGVGGNDFETRNLEPDAVKKVIDINLIGAVNSVHAVLPEMMKSRSGHLVAVSSLAGFRGIPKSAAYSASKAGMTAFFESVRLDTLGTGIYVTIVQPGFIRTPLTAGRKSKMPYLLDVEDALPVIRKAIEKRKKFCAFPWPTATLVWAGRLFPAWLYDRIAIRAKYRE